MRKYISYAIAVFVISFLFADYAMASLFTPGYQGGLLTPTFFLRNGSNILPSVGGDTLGAPTQYWAGMYAERIVASTTLALGTTTPITPVTFVSTTTATTTVTIGAPGVSGSKSCITMKTNTGGSVQLYVVGTTLTIQSGVCN